MSKFLFLIAYNSPTGLGQFILLSTDSMVSELDRRVAACIRITIFNSCHLTAIPVYGFESGELILKLSNDCLKKNVLLATCITVIKNISTYFTKWTDKQ